MSEDSSGIGSQHLLRAASTVSSKDKDQIPKAQAAPAQPFFPFPQVVRGGGMRWRENAGATPHQALGSPTKLVQSWKRTRGFGNLGFPLGMPAVHYAAWHLLVVNCVADFVHLLSKETSGTYLKR